MPHSDLRSDGEKEKPFLSHASHIARPFQQPHRPSTCARSCLFLVAHVLLARNCISSERCRGLGSDHGLPLPNIPASNGSARHVGIRLCKPLRDLRRVPPKYQHCTVYWIRECTTQQKLAVLTRLPCLLKVLSAKFCPSRNVVLLNLVEQNVMHLNVVSSTSLLTNVYQNAEPLIPGSWPHAARLETVARNPARREISGNMKDYAARPLVSGRLSFRSDMM